MFPFVFFLHNIFIYFFFLIFMSFLFFVFLVALGNFVFAVTHCRTPTQKKKNTVIRERQILLYSDFLSVCMTRGTVKQTNPIIITWKRRESEKKKWQKEKKKQRGGIVGQNVTCPQQVQENQIDGTGTPCLIRDPIGPPFGCRLL